MIQACGRSTAMWSVMVLALAGPTPMLTIVMPARSGAPGGRPASAAGAARRRSALGSARSRRARDHVARLDEGGVLAGRRGRHQLVAQLDELVDVELVVGEQHEVLEVLGRRAGVVAQPVQRVVHPRRGEQRQRLRAPGPGSKVPLAMPSSIAARSGRSNRSRSAGGARR
jgi:hypothetical protein